MFGLKYNATLNSGTVLAILPAGYRPAFKIQKNIKIGNLVGTSNIIESYLEIKTTGEIVYYGGNLASSSVILNIRENIMYFTA